MTSSSTQLFSGPLRRLILAFDVGTTYSGVAYAVLDPGEVPKIQGVTRYPGQENGDLKIPTIMYYTQDGRVRAVGAEAASSAMRLAAEDEGLIFIEWFKLHLRPKYMDHSEVSPTNLLQLPRGKTIVHVFGDFLAYLYQCAHRYICETHPAGDSLWQSMQNRIDFVLSHPNGWEGLQQSKMREAAVCGGLIPDTAAGYERVHFVTEGEASLQFCVRNGLASGALKAGSTVMVVDAGGGTIDLSTYTFKTVLPISVEECAPPDCILQGSTRVNLRAKTFLGAKLRNSRYGNEEDIKTMLDNFEKFTKPIFKDAAERSFVKFGSMRDRDPDVDIRSGQLLLAGTEVARFFEPSIVAIVDAIERQRSNSSECVSMVFLVGGFAASPWLSSQLRSSLLPMNLSLSRPDNHTNKAVAEGAVSFYLEHYVSVRVTKITYGTDCYVDYDETIPEHYIRRGKLRTRPSGKVAIYDGFSSILAKGSRIRENQEIIQAYDQEAPEASALNSIHVDVLCYRGESASPKWVDIEPEMFSTLCTVHADTSHLTKTQCLGEEGTYYKIRFQVVLLCGLTELKAQLRWEENGVEKRGPAKIIYEDDRSAIS